MATYISESIFYASESVTISEPTLLGEVWKDEVIILIIGHTGHGKSSLINILFGKEVAKVTHSAHSTDHRPVEEHELEVKGKKVTIIDTCGFGDKRVKPSTIIKHIRRKCVAVDLVLFCRNLYDKMDDQAEKEMKIMARQMGDELLERAVFVFTFGDQYKTRCDEYMNRKTVTNAFEKTRTHMIETADILQEELRKSLLTSVTSTAAINNIPYCIVSAKATKLPTADNWIKELWGLCENRSRSEAKPFMSYYKRHRMLVGGAGGGVLLGMAGGATVGATIGAIAGTIGLPVIGTGVGIVIGGVGGAVVGGAVVGGIVGVATGRSLLTSKKSKDEQIDPQRNIG